MNICRWALSHNFLLSWSALLFLLQQAHLRLSLNYFARIRVAPPRLVTLPAKCLRREQSRGRNSNAGKMDQTWYKPVLAFSILQAVYHDFSLHCIYLMDYYCYQPFYKACQSNHTSRPVPWIQRGYATRRITKIPCTSFHLIIPINRQQQVTNPYFFIENSLL